MEQESIHKQEFRCSEPIPEDWADWELPQPVATLDERTREVLLAAPTYKYPVDLDRAKNAASLFGWILHITTKTWVTQRHIKALIEVAEKENGIEVNRNF